tara:strand:- start:32 stop:253 length:222 start_codon:yes stop_codon:yes gene_type:complete
MSQAMQAKTVVLLIERKLSRRCLDPTIVILLKQNCKCYSAKKAAKLLPKTLEMGRSAQGDAGRLCLPLVSKAH